jgi:hypothetical protein
MSIKERIEKKIVVLYICVAERYSALQKKEILTVQQHGWSWRMFVLREIIQSQQDKLCIIPLIWDIKNKPIEAENIMGVIKNLVEWKMSNCWESMKFQLW